MYRATSPRVRANAASRGEILPVAVADQILL